MTRPVHITFLLLSLLGAPALAQDEQPAPVDDIIVTGRGLADPSSTPIYSVRTLGRDQIGQSASGRIEDVLSSVAGFQQFRRSDSRSSNPSAQGVTLRALGGNATSRALVLLDGVPLGDPFFGYVPLSAIDPSQLSSVRVTRGGGHGAFGGGALAGTIELTSANARELGSLNGAAFVNNRGESELSASIAPQAGGGHAVLAGRWDRGQGFWTTPSDQRVPASARARFESWSAGLRAAVPLASEAELQFRMMAFDDHRTLRFKGANATSSGQEASLRLLGTGRWQYDLLGYVQMRNFSNIVISSSTFTRTLDQYKTPTTGWGAKAELRPPLGEHWLLRLGGDLRVTEGDAAERAYNASTGAITARRRAGGRNSELGIFLENDLKLGAFTLTAGARVARWSIANGYMEEAAGGALLPTIVPHPKRAGWETGLRGGAYWRASDLFALRAAGYRAMRVPTLNELYRSFTVFPVSTRANAALQPERLEGYEIGADITPMPGAKLTLTAFDNKVRDAIANVTLTSRLRERQNIDAIRARGLEAAAEWSGRRFDLSASLAWTKARVEGSGAALQLDRMRPAQTPAIAANTTLGWKPRDGMRLTLTVRHVGEQFEDDLETDALPPVTTVDLYGEASLSRGIKLVLRGENLGNADIITRNQGGSIDLGVPRTLWVGVKAGI